MGHRGWQAFVIEETSEQPGLGQKNSARECAEMLKVFRRGTCESTVRLNYDAVLSEKSTGPFEHNGFADKRVAFERRGRGKEETKGKVMRALLRYWSREWSCLCLRK